jgi:hypothetical protein
LAVTADVRDDGWQEIEEEDQNDKEGDFGLVHNSSVRESVAEASWNAALMLRSPRRERIVARLMLPRPL